MRGVCAALTGARWLAAVIVVGACDGRPLRPPAESRPLASSSASPTGAQLAAALELAIQNNDLDAARDALSAGADPNAPLPGNDWTPLARAAMKENVNTIRLLLQAGADPKRTAQPHQDAWPILFVAVGADHPDIIQELVQAGADPNGRFQRRGDVTPLGWAAHVGATNACSLLPELGAAVDAWNLWPEMSASA